MGEVKAKIKHEVTSPLVHLRNHLAVKTEVRKAKPPKSKQSKLTTIFLDSGFLFELSVAII
ncbi:protein of unknown function [Limnospira indica PCC 8005]|uniref:Uncharacterized protein n=1 Tax=Limnospira indica PCC 8005 TaxID=376219 RepID=A0A9P1KJX3_9CYAN|nr:protein of unknown function [Limnospira indica PCC 8005]